MIEPTKKCKRCTEKAGKPVRKPWSEFYSSGRGQLAAHCKSCASILRLEHTHSRPDLARATQARYHARLMRDPERHERMLEQRRFTYRRNKGVTKISPQRPNRARVPAGPFATWLHQVQEREGESILGLSARLGVADRMLRNILHGQQENVDLGTVERALIADDTIMLRDLYPDLYAEA